MMSEIIEEIRKAVKASGKTRYRLSKASGVSEAQLSRLMSRERGLSADNLERLADALGLEIAVRPKQRRNRS